MRYRLTFESGLSALVDELPARRLIRQSQRRRHEVTRVRGGVVVTLPGGKLVALLQVP